MYIYIYIYTNINNALIIIIIIIIVFIIIIVVVIDCYGPRDRASAPRQASEGEVVGDDEVHINKYKYK